MRALRPLRGPGAGLALLVVVLWSSVAVALGNWSDTEVQLADRSDPSYAQDPGRFGRLSLALTEDAVPASTPLPKAGVAPGSALPAAAPTPSTDPSLDPTPKPSPNPTPTPPGPRPHLLLTMEARPTVAQVGDKITYRLTVRNEGDADAHEVTIYSQDPPYTTSGSACPASSNNPACVEGPRTHVFPIGTVRANGGSASVQFQVTIVARPPSGEIANYGWARAKDAPQVYSNVVIVTVEDSGSDGR